MPQVALDLDLAPELVLHFRVLQLRFEQHLHAARSAVTSALHD